MNIYSARSKDDAGRQARESNQISIGMVLLGYITEPYRTAILGYRQGTCLISRRMYLQTCLTCQHLIDNVSFTSTQNLGFRLLLDAAGKNDSDDPAIFSLRRLKNSCELAYREAVDQYRIHMLGHETRAELAKMAA